MSAFNSTPSLMRIFTSRSTLTLYFLSDVFQVLLNIRHYLLNNTRHCRRPPPHPSLSLQGEGLLLLSSPHRGEDQGEGDAIPWACGTWRRASLPLPCRAVDRPKGMSPPNSPA